jgi:hypothetical protein
MKAVGAIAAFIITLIIVPAQAKASSYCATGAAQEMIGSTNPEDDVTYVYSHCGEGDIIAIPGNTTLEIGEICDFTKTIVAEPNGEIMCVIGKQKPSH